MAFFAAFDKRRAATIVVVLLTAFATGHVMQTVLVERKPVATIESAPDAAPILRLGDQPRPLPTPPAATLIPILLSPPVLPNRTRESWNADREARVSDDCKPTLTVSSIPASMLKATIDAPCHSKTAVAIRQGPIHFDGVTDRDGQLELRLPALRKASRLTVDIAGNTLVAEAKVAEAPQYQHVAIMWEGQQNLRMHAYEFGARKSQFGHVWSGAPKSPLRASRGSGGFLTRLGDGVGSSAEIYSFPVGQTSLRGVVRLVVEAVVTQSNCGREIRAMALQTGPLGRMSETEVELVMPGCDQLGEITQLQNLLQDMRLAGR